MVSFKKIFRWFNAGLGFVLLFVFPQPWGFLLGAVLLFQAIWSFTPTMDKAIYHLVDCKGNHHPKDGHKHKMASDADIRKINRGIVT